MSYDRLDLLSLADLHPQTTRSATWLFFIGLTQGIKITRLDLLSCYSSKQMPRGGLRPRAVDGSLAHLMQPKWHLGQTKVIRVPIALEKQLLEIAHCLDQGKSIVMSQDNNDLLQANEQKILLRAIGAFIAIKQQAYGSNNAQKRKPFSTDSRSWDYFKEFADLAENSPEALIHD